MDVISSHKQKIFELEFRCWEDLHQLSHRGKDGIRSLLHKSSFSSCFSWYRLFFIKDNASRCSQALQNTISENINPSRLPLTLEFKPGIKAVQGIALEMGTLGNHTLCYQAIIQDKVCMINFIGDQ